MPVSPEVYVPWSSAGRDFLLFMVRTADDPLVLMKTIRHELAMVDRQVAVVQARP